MIKPFADTQLAAALNLFRDGANISADIADEMRISRAHANEIIRRLKRRGLLRWTGRHLPRDEGQPGRLHRVYEARQPPA